MATAQSRRGLRRAVGVGLASGLAGCAANGSDVPPSVTPVPVPSDRPSPTASPPRRPTPSAEALGFWVEVRDDFTASGPGRLEISLWNAGDRVLTVLDGPERAVPFVDDDYAGVDGSGHAGLLLVPEGASVRVDPDGVPAGPIGEFLPEEPTDGCWSVPFDWPADRGLSTAVLHAVTLEPGEIRRHAYALYFVDGCAPGDFRFENTFDLTAGDPPRETELVRARTAFAVAVDEAMGLEVAVEPPAVAVAGDG